MKKVSLATTLGLILLGSTAAKAGILLPDQSVAGKTQAEWGNLWYQQFLAIPASQNPLADTTGAFASRGNMGSVFFLAGSTTPAPVVRSATVLSNQFLFFPLINVISFAEVSAYGGTEAGLRRDAAETIGITPQGQAPNTTLFARLNGSDLPLPPPTTSLLNFRQVSPPGLFNVTLPDDNIFGLTPGIPVAPSVIDGWWLTLSPLAPGNYQLRFGGTTTGIGAYAGMGFSQDITYNLTVVPVPGPSGLVLFGIGVLSMGCCYILPGIRTSREVDPKNWTTGRGGIC
jgi:hypothetical protein